MARGRIARLPPEIRAQLDQLIRDGRLTLDEMVEELRGEGVEIPRSTLGTYRQKLERQVRRYREAQEVAGVWVARFGEQPDSQMGQLLAELLKTLAFQTLADAGEGEGVEPMELMLLAKSLDHMASAQKKDQEYRAKLQAAYRAEVAERAKLAEKEVAAVARGAGLTEEAAARLRELVLGVVG